MIGLSRRRLVRLLAAAIVSARLPNATASARLSSSSQQTEYVFSDSEIQLIRRYYDNEPGPPFGAMFALIVHDSDEAAEDTWEKVYAEVSSDEAIVETGQHDLAEAGDNVFVSRGAPPEQVDYEEQTDVDLVLGLRLVYLQKGRLVAMCLAIILGSDQPEREWQSFYELMIAVSSGLDGGQSSYTESELLQMLDAELPEGWTVKPEADYYQAVEE